MLNYNSTTYARVCIQYLPLCGSRTGKEGLTVYGLQKLQGVQSEPRAGRKSEETGEKFKNGLLSY